MNARPAFADILGITAPIVCAPMGGVAGGRLASAVSRAGALGTIGMGSVGSLAALDRELALLDTVGAPFGIGLVDWVMQNDPALLERALDVKPALLSVSFGDWSTPPRWVDAAHERGILTITQAATVADALAAEAAGIDAVVARGKEGGGHGAPLEPRTRLLAEVVAAVRVPVLAGGAISTATDLRAALDAGAAAGWVGTAFAACPEALTGEDARAALLEAGDDATLVTRERDIAQGYGWPERYPERVLKRDPTVSAGQGVFRLDVALPAAKVVRRLTAG